MAAVGKRKFPTFFICWSDSRNHSWALAWLGVGGREGAPPRAEPRDAERPGGPTEAVALDTPKASPFLPWDPVNAPFSWATLSWFTGTTASPTEFHPLTVTSGSLPSVSPQTKWEDSEAPL